MSKSKLALLTLILAPFFAHAAPEPLEQPRPLMRVYVPRDEFAALLAGRQQPARLVPVAKLKQLLDDDFRRRLGRETGARKDEDKAKSRFPRDLVVDRAEIGVSVSPDRSFARLEVSLSVSLHDVEEASLPIPSKGLLFEKATLDEKDALLIPEGDAHKITIAGDGAHTLVYRAIAPVAAEGFSQAVTFPLPPFPSGLARVKIPGTDLEVRLEPGIDLEKTVADGVTSVTAGLAGGTSLKVSWYTVARHSAKVGEVKDEAAKPGAAPKPATGRATPIVFAETCHVAGFSDSKLEGLVEVRFNVYRAPVSSLTVKLPEGLGPVTVIAPSEIVAEKLVSPSEVKVVLATPTEGEVGFAIRYKRELELKPNDRSATAVVPELVPASVAAETGYLVVNRLANVRLEPAQDAALEPLATAPLPPHFAHHRGTDSLFVYRYLAHPAALKVKILRYENEEVLTAVVDRQVATTLFARGGGQLTVVDYFIRNEHTEFLKLELPKGVEPERVLVDGKRVSASRDEGGGVRIPIKAKDARGVRVVRASVAFRTERADGGRAFSAVLPKIDLPALKLAWRWLVPDDTVLVHFRAGARALRATPRLDPTSSHHIWREQVPDAAGMKPYFVDEGLVAKRQALEIVAEPLAPAARLLPMLIFFLLGVLSVELVLRMLVKGTFLRAALLVLAVSYLSLQLVAEETELILPYSGGVKLTLWLAAIGAGLAAARAVARTVLARFGAAAVVLALVASPVEAGGGSGYGSGGGSWFPFSIGRSAKKAPSEEVDAKQAAEEEEKRQLENLQNSLQRRNRSLQMKQSGGKESAYNNDASVTTTEQPANEESAQVDGPAQQQQQAAPMDALTKSYVDKLTRMTPDEREKLKSSIQKFAPEPIPQPRVLAPLRVILPYDETPGGGPDAVGLVDQSELAALEAPKPSPSPSVAPPVPVVLRDGNLIARVEGKRVKVNATYRARVFAEGFVAVPLPLGAAALDEAKVDGKPLLLTAAQQALIEGTGDHTLEIALSLPVSEHEDQGEFTLVLPSAPMLSLELSIPKPKLMVDLSTGQGIGMEEKDGGTVIQAVLPGGEVRVRWAPRPSTDEPAPEPAAGRAAEEDVAPVEGASAQADGKLHTEYLYENGVLTARTRVHYKIFPPGRESLSLWLPKDMELLSVVDGAGKPVPDHALAKDGKFTFYLPARITGEQVFEVVQKKPVAVKREAGGAARTPLSLPPAALADVTRGEVTAMLRVAADNARIDWARKPEQVIAMREVPAQLRSAFQAVQWIWRVPEPTSGENQALDVSIQMMASSETRSFKLESLEAWTLVTDAGETLTRCVYRVRNTGEQFFSLRLPPDSRIESAFVHTRAVTPGKGAQAQEYYIPLVMSRQVPNQDAEPFDVEVAYTSRVAGALGAWGSASLTLPALNDDVERVSLSVFLPEGYLLSPAEGAFRFAGPASYYGGMQYPPGGDSGLPDDEGWVETNAKRESKERQDAQAPMAVHKKGKASVVLIPESSTAGLLPIRLEFPNANGGSSFTKGATRPTEELAVSFSYCRNKLIELLRACLHALAFMCVTGLFLAMVRKTPVLGPLFGTMISLVGLFVVESLFPRGGIKLAGVGAAFGLLFAYLMCWPVRRWFGAGAAATAVVLLALAAGPARAQAPTVLVPFDDKSGAAAVIDASGAQGLVPADVPKRAQKRDEDEQAKKDTAKPVPPVPFVVQRGELEATVTGAVAQLDVTYDVRVLAEGWQRVPLLTGDLTVGQVTIGKDQGAVVVDENEAYVQQELWQNAANLQAITKSDASVKNVARDLTAVLLVRGPGQFTVKFQAEATVAVDAGGARRLSLAPPVFPQGSIKATFNSGGLNVEGQGVSRFETQEDKAKGTTTVQAALTPQRPVVLSWTERAAAEEPSAPEAAAPAPEASASAAAPVAAPAAPAAEIEPLVIASSISKLTVDDASLRGDVVYTATVHRRGVSSLTFRCPPGVNIYEVSGADVSSPHRERTTKDGKLVIVEFKRRFSGTTSFIIRYHQPHKPERKEDRRMQLTVPAIQCREAAFESGTIGVEREGGVEVAEIVEKRRGLERVELPRLDPEVVRLLPGQILLAYSFASPGWVLALSVLRHQEVKELQTAVIDRLEARSTVSDQQVTHTLTFDVKNSGCPFLEVQLPPKTSLRRVLLKGRQVTASREPDAPDKHLIGLESPATGETNVVDQKVVVEYAENTDKLESAGTRTVTLAKMNIPVLGRGLRWVIELPKGKEFLKVTGGVHPGLHKAFLHPFHAVPHSRGNKLVLDRPTVTMGEAVDVSFQYGSSWALLWRLILATVLGFLMAAFIVSGVTWITEPDRGLPRLVLAGIVGLFAIALETRLPGTGAGLYAGGLLGVVAPVGVRFFRVVRRWTGFAVVALALSLAPAHAQETDIPEPTAAEETAAAPESKDMPAIKPGAGSKEIGSEVLVPHARLAKQMAGTKEWSVLPRSTIGDLLARLARPAPAKPDEPEVQAPLAYVILSGTLTGKAAASSVAFEATYAVQAYRKGVVRLGFDPHEISVRSVTLDGKPAPALMDGTAAALAVPDALQVYVAEPGLHTIAVSFTARVDVVKEVANLQLAIPACPATELDLAIPVREPAVSVVPSTHVAVAPDGEGQRLRTRLKYTQTLFVRWRDRHQPVPKAATSAAAPEEQTVFEVAEDARYQLLPGMVDTRVKLAVTVRSGAVSSLSLAVPDGAAVVSVEAVGMSRWRPAGEAGRIEVPFHSKMRGAFTVDVHCVSKTEESQATDRGTMVTQAGLPAITVERALAQAGIVRLFLPAGEDVREETTDRTLTKIDPSEAPCSDGSPAGDRVYRSLRPGWKMKLHRVRHEEVATSSTRVTSGHVRVLVPRQGLRIARATYMVENETAQFLKVRLPRHSILLSATVDGQPRRPSKEEDAYLVPLAKSQMNGSALAAFPVVLVYGVVGDDDLTQLGRLSLNLPAPLLPVDRITLEIGTPKDVFLFGEDGAFMSRETSTSGVLERVLALERLPNPAEIFFGMLTLSAYRETRGAPMSLRSEPASAPQPMPMASPQFQNFRDRERRPRRLSAANRMPQQKAARGMLVSPEDSMSAIGGAAAEAAPAPAAEFDADILAEKAKDQQLESFVDMMKKSSGSTGALPVDIQVPLEQLGMRVTRYTLLLSAPGATPGLTLGYVSMRWGGAVGGVFFFLLPICLIALGLSPGASRATRVLPLLGLAASGLAATALTLWGLDVLSWFLAGLPAGVVAAPLLKLNRSLAAADGE